jgi:hypothetical protein
MYFVQGSISPHHHVARGAVLRFSPLFKHNPKTSTRQVELALQRLMPRSFRHSIRECDMEMSYNLGEYGPHLEQRERTTNAISWTYVKT